MAQGENRADFYYGQGGVHQANTMGYRPPSYLGGNPTIGTMSGRTLYHNPIGGLQGMNNGAGPQYSQPQQPAVGMGPMPMTQQPRPMGGMGGGMGSDGLPNMPAGGQMQTRSFQQPGGPMVSFQSNTNNPWANLAAYVRAKGSPL